MWFQLLFIIVDLTSLKDIDLFRCSFFSFLCELTANCVFQEIGLYHLGNKMCVLFLSQFSFSYSYMAFWFSNFSTIKNHYHFVDFKSNSKLFLLYNNSIEKNQIFFLKFSYTYIWASWEVLVIKNLPVSVGDIRDSGMIPG